jgi:hypothetical protein
MSCPGCDNSSTTYTRCNPPVSTNCVFYQGDTKTCQSDTTFTICKGENMSDLQEKIFTKICALNASIDVTSIEFPCSLQDAWNNEDPTLLNLLQYIVDRQCEQNQAIQELGIDISKIDPLVTVCLECCSDKKCGTTQMLLSQALKDIIECLCKAKTDAANAVAQADLAVSTATNAINLYSELNSKYCVLNAQVTKIASYLNDNNIGPGIALPSTCPS